MTDDRRTERTEGTHSADRTDVPDPTEDSLRDVHPLENPAESRAELQAERSDADSVLGPLGEPTSPADPPNANASLGESGGAGMENPGTDQPDTSRERFREIRM